MDDKITKHESMGIVEISRISSSGTYLVGSEVEHQHFFSLTIKEAEKIESYGEIKFHGHGIPLINIYFSANQLMDMITMTNTANAATCTIGSFNGVQRERPVKEVSRIQLASQYGLDRTTTAIQRSKDIAENILEECNSLSKGKKENIKKQLEELVAHARDNHNFFLTRITEATEKSIQIAKTEVESFVSSTVRALGLKSLRSLAKALEEGKE